MNEYFFQRVFVVRVGREDGRRKVLVEKGWMDRGGGVKGEMEGWEGWVFANEKKRFIFNYFQIFISVGSNKIKKTSFKICAFLLFSPLLSPFPSTYTYT